VVKKHNIGRLVRMHSNDMQEIDASKPGDIVALFGIDCASGTTFTDGKINVNMTSMFVPSPVIELVIEAKNRDQLSNLSKGLNRFTKEDPTFTVEVDGESGQTIIKGMGELHLEVYIERLKREFGVELETGNPQVAYRESITIQAPFDYTHKKQTGGSGQFGKVQGYVLPLTDDAREKDDDVFKFESKVVGGRISKDYIPAVQKGFKSALESGSLIGFPVVDVSVVLEDGAMHDVDSSDMAFMIAGRQAFRQAYQAAKPCILEPMMKVEVETPTEFQGSVLGNVSQRRGMVQGSAEDHGYATISSEVPLSEMFGYATELRSMTQGKAEFTMEFARYAPVPKSVQEELMKKYADRASGGGQG
jgi:elongation factor G